jgi:hypothetical protein
MAPNRSQAPATSEPRFPPPARVNGGRPSAVRIISTSTNGPLS